MYVYCVNAYNSADHAICHFLGFQMALILSSYMYVYLLTVFIEYSKASFELMSTAMYLVKCLAFVDFMFLLVTSYVAMHIS